MAAVVEDVARDDLDDDFEDDPARYSDDEDDDAEA